MALRWCRALAALLRFSAVVTEIAVLVERHRFVAANFFSYFTVESNLIAAAVLLAAALAPSASARIDLFRGAATVYLVVTFVVFAVLLSGYDPGRLTAVPWDNTVLHQLMPVVMVVDWLVVRPRRIALRTALWWLVFPLVYLAWSLARGPIVGWYPYPFLDPAHGGYGRVALTSLAIAVFVVAVTWLVTRWGSAGPGGPRAGRTARAR